MPGSIWGKDADMFWSFGQVLVFQLPRTVFGCASVSSSVSEADD